MLAPHERRLLIAISLILATGAAADWIALHRPREAAWLVGADRVADLRDAGRTGGTEPADSASSVARSSRASEGAKRRPGPSRRSGTYDSAGRLELNSADSAAIVALRGVGPALAGRLLAERRRRGGFTSLEELLRVKGIGPKTLDRLRSQLFLEAAKDSAAGGR